MTDFIAEPLNNEAILAAAEQNGAAAFDEVYARLPAMIKDLGVNTKAQIKNKGMTLREISLKFDLDPSALSKGLSRGFSFPLERIYDLFQIVWPGRTIDEVIFHENIPTELGPTDTLFVFMYGQLYPAQRKELLEKMKTMPTAPRSFYSQFAQLGRDRGQENPTIELFPRNVRNACVVRSVRTGTGLHLRSALAIAICTQASLDYYLGDYSRGDIYCKSGNGRRHYPSKAEREGLSQFIRLSDADKQEVFYIMSRIQTGDICK